jgi:hypothetical protein
VSLKSKRGSRIVDDKALFYLAEALKVQVSRTLSAENARKSHSRFHGETGDDAIIYRRIACSLAGRNGDIPCPEKTSAGVKMLQ